jgi:hypothetical protein
VRLDEGLAELAAWSLEANPPARDLVDEAYAELMQKKLVK